MKKILVCSIFVLVSCLARVTSAQLFSQPNAFLNHLGKLEINSTYDVSAVNRPLLQKFGGLSKSPAWMIGPGYTLEVSYPVTRRLSAFLHFNKEEISGRGPWEEGGGQYLDQGITEVQANGKVKTRLRGLGPGGEFRIWNGRKHQLALSGDYLFFRRTSIFRGDCTVWTAEGYNFVVPAMDIQSDKGKMPELRLKFKRQIGPLWLGPAMGYDANGIQLSIGGQVQVRQILRFWTWR